MKAKGLVEFIGHAGAGKSTLAAAVQDELTRRGFAVRRNSAPARRPSRLHALQDLRRMATSPLVSLQGLLLLGAVGRVDKQHVGILAEMTARCDARRHSTADVRLDDEGVLHALWSLCLLLPPPPGGRLDALLRALPLPEVVVSVRPPLDEVVRQFRARGTPHRLQALSVSELRSRFQNLDPILDAMEAACGPPSGPRLIRVSAPASAGVVVAEEVAAILRR